IAARVPEPKRLADPFTAILDHLDRSHTRVEQVYALDKAGAYSDKNNDEARQLVYTCTAEAATLLRDLLYTSWGESQVAAAMQTVQPSSAKHPQFNPATGSAPAPKPQPR